MQCVQVLRIGPRPMSLFDPLEFLPGPLGFFEYVPFLAGHSEFPNLIPLYLSEHARQMTLQTQLVDQQAPEFKSSQVGFLMCSCQIKPSTSILCY